MELFQRGIKKPKGFERVVPTGMLNQLEFFVITGPGVPTKCRIKEVGTREY